MAVVLTLDQRESRQRESLVVRWADDLNRRYEHRLLLAFEVAAGDEVQGVIADSEPLVDVVLDGVRFGQWWVGAGIGPVEPLAQTASHSRGPAFTHAREAVNAAKKSRYGFAVRGESDESARAVEALLRCLAFIARRRGVPDSKRWEAVDLMRESPTVERAAEMLGITHQSFSDRLRTAGWDEEREARWLCGWLLKDRLNGTKAADG